MASLTVLGVILSITLPFAVALLVFRRLGRRSPPPLCSACGYDLRVTDSTTCPECGAVSTERMPADTWVFVALAGAAGLPFVMWVVVALVMA